MSDLHSTETKLTFEELNTINEALMAAIDEASTHITSLNELAEVTGITGYVKNSIASWQKDIAEYVNVACTITQMIEEV